MAASIANLASSIVSSGPMPLGTGSSVLVGKGRQYLHVLNWYLVNGVHVYTAV